MACIVCKRSSREIWHGARCLLARIGSSNWGVELSTDHNVFQERLSCPRWRDCWDLLFQRLSIPLPLSRRLLLWFQIRVGFSSPAAACRRGCLPLSLLNRLLLRCTYLHVSPLRQKPSGLSALKDWHCTFLCVGLFMIDSFGKYVSIVQLGRLRAVEKPNGKTSAQSSKKKKSRLLKKPIGGKIANSKRR